MIFSLGGVPLPVLARCRIYVCGITPYDTTHIGHAATFVWVDTLARILDHVGVEAQVCRNITDVDDDLLSAARDRGTDPVALATQQTYRFEDDMRKLRVGRPAFEPRAREYVTDVIFLARALLDRGVAQEVDGDVWFGGVDTESGQKVWQASRAGEPAWSSPWGPGRPGWHAECAAMATSLLGLGIDVQAGGADLAEHHTHSAELVEAATGVSPFARTAMHVGTVLHNGEKVAKSTGNLVFVEDLLRRWPGEVLRLHLLDRRWDEPWEFRENDVATTGARLESLLSKAATIEDDPAATRAALEALAADLDVPRALDIAEDAGGGTTRTIGKVLGIL